MSSRMVALGSCWGCNRIFEFDVDRVPSVLIDPGTRLPPDQGGDPGRAQREPICPDCCRAANPSRLAAGLEPLEPLPAEDDR
jgi:hypothetical protein